MREGLLHARPEGIAEPITHATVCCYREEHEILELALCTGISASLYTSVLAPVLLFALMCLVVLASVLLFVLCTGVMSSLYTFVIASVLLFTLLCWRQCCCLYFCDCVSASLEHYCARISAAIYTSVLA